MPKSSGIWLSILPARAVVAQQIIAAHFIILVVRLRLDARERVVRVDAVARHDARAALVAWGGDAHGEHAVPGNTAFKKRDGIHNGNGSALPDVFAQTAVNVLADIAVRDGIEIAQLSGTAKTIAPSIFRSSFPFLKTAGRLASISASISAFVSRSSWYILSQSSASTPCAARNCVTVVLPLPEPPVTPMSRTPRSARFRSSLPARPRAEF